MAMKEEAEYISESISIGYNCLPDLLNI